MARSFDFVKFKSAKGHSARLHRAHSTLTYSRSPTWCGVALTDAKPGYESHCRLRFRANFRPGITTRRGSLLPLGPLGVVVSALVSPRQLVERWLIATSAVAIFRHVEFLMLVIFYANAVLSAPAISFSVDAMRFHNDRISSNVPGRHTCQGWSNLLV